MERRSGSEINWAALSPYSGNRTTSSGVILSAVVVSPPENKWMRFWRICRIHMLIYLQQQDNSPVTERAHVIVGKGQAISGNIKQTKQYYSGAILIFGLHNSLDLIWINTQTTTRTSVINSTFLLTESIYEDFWDVKYTFSNSIKPIAAINNHS